MDNTQTRRIYLEKVSLDQARRLMLQTFSDRGLRQTETIPVSRAVGRVLAAGVTSRVSSPAHAAAAMDGIAVAASSTFGAGETTPRTLAVGSQAFFINTGNLLPAGTDAVIMIEDVHTVDETTVEIMAPAFPWQHVRKAGEDIVATELLFPANHVFTPYCLGALLSAGIFTVPVKKRPAVLIIPTGNELVEWHENLDPAELEPGLIPESNSYMLGSLVESCGGEFTRHAILPDDAAAIQTAVQRAASSGLYEMILVVGGSSAGAQDFARTAIEAGGRVLVHGVTIMPGKPVIIGQVNELPVFGMPGYPVSAIICFDRLVRPLLMALQGLAAPAPATIPAVLARQAASKLGVEEFLRVKLGRVADTVVATQLPRGAGSITSLAEADAFVRIPPDTEGLPEGEPVRAELIWPSCDVDNTVVIVGSHDNTLDVLADMVTETDSRIRLASTHVGSMGGLMALSKGFSHLGGCHLLDPETGEYNLSYIRKYLPKMNIRLVKLVRRQQGLMVAAGNPLGIQGLEDLVDKQVRFINRQGGSGTRVLLDYRLTELGLEAGRINGYENEEYTHMSVAIAVKSGAADAGLGILAAARALGLEFVPVVTEEYDLVIPESFWELPGIRVLRQIVQSSAFADRVARLGGYDTAETGRMITLP
ncbi:MAG: molybdopterin biosynthesis protein [Desulfosudaceae bacterium]